MWVAADSRAALERPGCSSTIGLPVRAPPASPARESARLAELLDDHGDDTRVGIIEQKVDIVLDAARGLVAGRDGIGEAEAAARERDREHGRHRAALRDEADAGRAAQPVARQFDEGRAARRRRN